MWPEESPSPYFEYNPPWRGPGSQEDEEALLDFDLKAPPELGPKVNCFLQGLADSLGEEDRKRSSPEPPVEDLESWVTWRAQVHDRPDLWQELTEIPGIDDHKNWHRRCGPLSNSCGGSVNGTVLRITIRPHWHCHASVGRASCCCMTLSFPAKIDGNCSRRRWWPMPKPSSFGWKNPICLLRANHAFSRECSGAQGGDEMLCFLL